MLIGIKFGVSKCYNMIRCVHQKNKIETTTKSGIKPSMKIIIYTLIITENRYLHSFKLKSHVVRKFIIHKLNNYERSAVCNKEKRFTNSGSTFLISFSHINAQDRGDQSFRNVSRMSFYLVH